MDIAQRTLTILSGLLKRHGTSNTKKVLWDKEFSSGKWNFIDNTLGDCVYPYLEKYLKGGSILDLGCGPGNTATELPATAYGTYVGVDISAAALAKAWRRTEETCRAGKNHFAQGDFLSYVPSEHFDVILFREAMYHVPLGKVQPMLERYSQYLRDGAVFIVRMSIPERQGKTKHRLQEMAGVIETEFDIVESYQDGESGPKVIVFQPRRRALSLSATK